MGIMEFSFQNPTYLELLYYCLLQQNHTSKQAVCKLLGFPSIVVIFIDAMKLLQGYEKFQRKLNIRKSFMVIRTQK